MAEAEYTTTAELPIETIWEFVREMDNWGHMLTGYQEHQKQSETRSVWTLKGDVGVLARIVKFQVEVTEWAGPGRVSFALEGLNEPMSGDGEFRMESIGPGLERAAPASSGNQRGFFGRLIDRLFRFLFRLRHGGPQRIAAGPGDPAGGGPGTRLTFRLTIHPGGPMAPMVDALMTPAMLPAAEDLAEKIMAHLEAREARGDS